MWKQLFDNAELLDLPVKVMLFFFAVFLAVLVRVTSRRRAQHYRDMAHLPLDEEA